MTSNDKDLFGVIVGLLIVAIAIILLPIVSRNGEREQWVKDCETIGSHRVDDKAYDCKPRERAK